MKLTSNKLEKVLLFLAAGILLTCYPCLSVMAQSPEDVIGSEELAVPEMTVPDLAGALKEAEDELNQIDIDDTYANDKDLLDIENQEGFKEFMGMIEAEKDAHANYKDELGIENQELAKEMRERAEGFLNESDIDVAEGYEDDCDIEEYMGEMDERFGGEFSAADEKFEQIKEKYLDGGGSPFPDVPTGPYH